MKSTSRTIFIISGDAATADRCIEELAAYGGHNRNTVVGTVEQARKRMGRRAPAAVFLDESAIDGANGYETLESAVALLTENAPVVVAAAPEKQTSLSFLIISGAVDFVSRSGQFLPIVAGMLDRRLRIAERATGTIQFPKESLAGDFGEILRHEVNNPLTGILGNTELLLTRRDGLPPAAVERLETIADLAVRLRETVRYLSNAWDENHEHAESAKG
ncbi:MAG TPA: histidine kinase dimerization/phospho-acceptor domain-containing protein [Candidatus Acidoferrales bacterium]|jgi:signal transduction histidine kinase|nr:histidine kinase dimerization/phospho-acceptor domain-containing protein [Candidatus Acidoferrales bacterium]